MTPAIDLLRALGIDHSITEYAHDPENVSYGDEAVLALGVDADAVFKTLLVSLDSASSNSDSLAVAVVPVGARLDLKAVAHAAGAKRATMADPTEAERRTGYVLGGISPFGQKRQFPTFVDEWALALDVVHCSGGRRGLEVSLAPEAFVDALDATFTAIAIW